MTQTQVGEDRVPTEPHDVAIVRIWDWPVRLVHWALVLLLVVLIVSVNIGGDAMVWHMRAGETVLALLMFRVIWGFIGSRHARFTSFVRGPRAVFSYARSIIRPPHQWHAGHNPLGGWMVIALLLALLAQAGTGLLSNDDIAYEGPLVHRISKDLSDAITSFHHKNGWLIVGLAGVHIAAVLVYLFALKDNLIRPMIDGVKRGPASALVGTSVGTSAHAHHAPTENPYGRRALIVLALCACAVWWVVTRV